MTLVPTLLRRVVVCWLVMLIVLVSCSLPVLGADGSADLPPGHPGSPLRTSVEHRTDYPLAWHNLRPTWFMNVPDVRYTVRNPTAEPVWVRLVSEYPGYSAPTVSVSEIGAGSPATFDHFVVLDREEIQEIRAPARVAVHYRIEYWDGGNWTVHDEQTDPVTFYPMDQMVWATEDKDGVITIYHGLIAIFVTPQSPGVAALAAKAKERATGEFDRRYVDYGMERTLPGYALPDQRTTYADTKNRTALQVKAIYNALKYDYNLSYVDALVAFGMGDSQRVSTPDESLATGSANCIDGAVLFASAIERLGMQPYIVVVPGHAYVAWKTDKAGTEVDALETTWVSSCDFERAYDAGTKRYKEDAKSGRMELYQSLFDRRLSRNEYDSIYVLVEIRWLRSQGILPMK